MAASKRNFDRWAPHDKTSWVFQVFRKYSTELLRLISAQTASAKFTYKMLGERGAHWGDLPSIYMPFAEVDSHFGTLAKWSESFNLMDQWLTLSALLTTASNLETYLASIVGLALDSDPGILLGAPRAVDGAALLKGRIARPKQVETYIEGCTKGNWSERLGVFESVFGPCPAALRNYHPALEELREIRNRFGHAFGRDIKESRKHGRIEIAPMERISVKRRNRLMREAWDFAREIDLFLLIKHIGDFEAVYFYRSVLPRLKQGLHVNQRAAIFKKEIGSFGAGPRGKVYSSGLVKYWDSL